MGRIPKLVKERALLEQKEQQMKQEAGLTEHSERSDGGHARESPCSSLSDRSIENYDPNTMETDLIDMQVSAMRRNCQSSKIYLNNSSSQQNSSLYNDRFINRSAIPSTISECDLSSNLNCNRNQNQTQNQSQNQ
ncbi:unnamed protein product, partial [Rotaria magnacalcarata]